MPYTYIIGWPSLNKWYYGVRYAKNCQPDDLWKSYWTSSRHVSAFRLLHGHSEKTRKALGDRWRGVEKEKVTCPHCNKIGGKNTMGRWHFDNCKVKEKLEGKS